MVICSEGIKEVCKWENYVKYTVPHAKQCWFIGLSITRLLLKKGNKSRVENYSIDGRIFIKSRPLKVFSKICDDTILFLLLREESCIKWVSMNTNVKCIKFCSIWEPGKCCMMKFGIQNDLIWYIWIFNKNSNIYTERKYFIDIHWHYA